MTDSVQMRNTGWNSGELRGIYYRLDTTLKAKDFYIFVLKAGFLSSLTEEKLEQRPVEGDMQVEPLLQLEDSLKKLSMTCVAYRRKIKEQQTVLCHFLRSETIEEKVGISAS